MKRISLASILHHAIGKSESSSKVIVKREGTHAGSKLKELRRTKPFGKSYVKFV